MTTAATTIVRSQNAQLGVALMCCGLAMFACGETMVKLLARDHSVAQIVWARYTFHALVFLAVFSRIGIVRQVRTTRPGLQLARSVLLLAATAFFFTALRYIPMADAVAINFVSPLLVTAFSIPILGEHVGPRRWAAIVVGFAGAMVIIRPGMGEVHWAVFMPLGTALCYALHQILTRIASRTDDSRTSLFWTSAVGVLGTSALVPFFWTQPDATGWLLMVATGTAFGFGHYLLIRGLEVAPASLLSPFIYTQIVWTALLGYLVFDQFPDRWTVTGVGIVIASGLYVWRRETAGPRRISAA
jgi:drug/metabolite transporter (DMT)-like permease